MSSSPVLLGASGARTASLSPPYGTEEIAHYHPYLCILGEILRITIRKKSADFLTGPVRLQRIKFGAPNFIHGIPDYISAAGWQCRQKFLGPFSEDLVENGKPIGPITPIKKPLRPLGRRLSLGRQGVTRGYVPQNPINRPSEPERVSFLARK